MTATDEMRAMLDERGVEWRKPSQEYWMLLGMPEGDSSTIVGELSIEEAIDGTLVIWNATPEQAIAATLGSCNCSSKCSNGERTGTCYDTGESRIFHCSECGLGLDDVFIDDEEYYPFADFPRFCPFCGAKVVGE